MPAKILATVSIESNHTLVATPRCPRQSHYCYSDKTRLSRVIKRCKDFVCLQTDDHLSVVVCAAAHQDDIAITSKETNHDSQSSQPDQDLHLVIYVDNRELEFRPREDITPFELAICMEILLGGLFLTRSSNHASQCLAIYPSVERHFNDITIQEDPCLT